MLQTRASLWVLAVLVLQGCSATNVIDSYLASLLGSSSTDTSDLDIEQSMEATVHGITATTEQLNEYAQTILDVANVFNAKSFSDMNFDANFRNVVDALIDKEHRLCVDVDCSAVPDTYRTINGVCNNKANPLYGSSKTAQIRMVEPEWEKTALVEFNLEDPSEEVAVDQYGVDPTVSPLIFHLRGNTGFELILLMSDLSTTTVDCEPGADCHVEGIVTGVEAESETQDCTEGVNLGYKGNGIFVSGPCSGSFSVNYLPYAARVGLDPSGSNTITIAGEIVAEHTADSSLFPNLDSNPQMYWVDYRRKTLRVGTGSECDETTVIMKTTLKEKVLTNQARFAFAVAITNKGRCEVAFPVRETLRIQTIAHDRFNMMEKNLDGAPWLYSQGSLRFGVKANLKSSPVIINLYDNTHNILVRVTLGLRNTGSIESFKISSDGSTALIDECRLKNFRGGSDFELYDGSFKKFARKAKKKKAGSAFWITWFSNRIYAGTGNVIGKGSIPDALGLTLPASERFTVSRVTLGSAIRTTWYFDIVRRNIPRSRSLTGRPLPTARDISLCIHSNGGQETVWSKQLTNAVFQFGQFLDHDITLTPTLSHKSVKPCCEAKKIEDNLNRFCFPIVVTDKTDATGSQGQFSSSEFECLPFIRSTTMIECDPEGRDLRNRNNINMITSFVDASQVYGPEKDLALELRTGAYLATADKNELPHTFKAGEGTCITTDKQQKPCRLSGDPRNNEQPMLNSLHTLWVREHNRIVMALIQQGYGNTTEEEQEILYQEARRIVIAEMQVITYKEFLPSFMDKKILKDFKVTSSCKYNPDINPSLPNEVGIAYRFGHTWIPILLGRLTLIENFFNPAQSYTSEGSDGLLYQMHNIQCPATDRILEQNVLNDLFRVESFANDLGALNIQRGRDHGVGTYCALREYFNLTVPETFQDMVRQNLVTQETADRLKDCYDCVCDMDLFSAVLAETPMNERSDISSTSTIGPLLNHILAEFFSNVKCGDRFWFEFAAAGFSDAQIAELKKTSLSRLLCDNVDSQGITRIQPNAFLMADRANNKIVTCDDIPALDMTKFGPSVAKKGVDTETLRELDNLLDILRELEEEP